MVIGFGTDFCKSFPSRGAAKSNMHPAAKNMQRRKNGSFTFAFHVLSVNTEAAAQLGERAAFHPKALLLPTEIVIISVVERRRCEKVPMDQLSPLCCHVPGFAFTMN
jgi:hypothetical protein